MVFGLTPLWAQDAPRTITREASEDLVEEPRAPPAGRIRPNVFFDCSGPNCDSQYYRTEINWVSWVNDHEVADVHVIMGSISTGAGGREYQLDFLGVETGVEPEGRYEEQLLYQALSTDTRRETLDGLTFTLALGLAEWANTNGYRGLVTLQGTDPELGVAGQRIVSAQEVSDPWDLWVFRVNGNLDRDGEEKVKTTRVSGGFNASRVSPTWKVNFNIYGSQNRLFRELSTGDFNDVRTEWTFRPLIAYSVADHWSVGMTSRVGRSPRFNRDLRVDVSPVLEYSFFPYEEATRRSLTAMYTIGPRYSEYIEPTVYSKTEELRYRQQLEVDFSSRQQWGDAGFRIRVSHFLHDIHLNRRELRGNINYRLTRGIRIFANGNIAWVSDQIYLPSAGPTDEEALLNLERQATDRESSISVGLSLQFGSIYNNVVNNRFRGAGRF